MNIEQLNTILANLASTHLQINDFYFGTLSRALNRENVLVYPCMIVSIEDVKYNKLLSTFTLKLFFLDKLLAGEENMEDVLEEMQSIANDYYLLLTNEAWVKDYLMIDSANGVQIADRLPDDVAGWVLTLQCRSYSALCLNDLPITGSVPQYEKCKVEGEIDNVIVIGANNQITDSGIGIGELALASQVPTHLSQLQQNSQYRTVTDSEKTIWNKIGKYKGVYSSYQALVSGVPNPEAGDWAHVDVGASSNIMLFIYDATDNDWKNVESSGAPETDPIFMAWIATNPIPTHLNQLQQDANHRVVTDNEKQYWNNKQEALGYTPINIDEKGVANGICPLDAGAKVPLNHFPSTLLIYKGVYDVQNNVPYLENNDPTKKGQVYNVAVAGTRFGIEFKLGDWLMFNENGVIEKSDNSDDVVSVNGKQGYVVLNTDDIDEGTRKYTTLTSVADSLNNATTDTIEDSNDIYFRKSNTIRKSTWLTIKNAIKDYLTAFFAPSGSNRSVQFNNNGSLNGASKVGVTTSGSLNIQIDTDVITPPANSLTFYASEKGKRVVPTVATPCSTRSILQQSFATSKITMFTAAGIGTAVSQFGTSLTATGTAQSIAISLSNIHTYTQRVEYAQTTASTSNVVGLRFASLQYALADASRNYGGFYMVIRFGYSRGEACNATRRGFFGLTSVTAAPTDANPTTWANIIGVGHDNTDTNFMIMHREGTSAVTKINTGITKSYPDATEFFELILFSAVSVGGVGYEFRRMSDNTVVSGVITTNLPSLSTLLTLNTYTSVGGTNSVIGVAYSYFYIERDV